MASAIDDARMISRAFCEIAPVGELIDWSVRKLLDGADGKAVVELAGLNPWYSCVGEAFPLFKRALRELGIATDDRDEALREYFLALLREIDSGRLEPGEGLTAVNDEIIRVGLYEARYPEFEAWYDRELRLWVFLDEEREMGEPTSAELAGKVKIAAKDCLRSNACGRKS